MNTLAVPVQALDEWLVSGEDRIVGKVLNRGFADGQQVITSPVMEVQLVGDPPKPVALTATGSRYRLLTPAATFGTGNAEDFVRKKTKPAVKSNEAADPLMQTQRIKLR